MNKASELCNVAWLACITVVATCLVVFGNFRVEVVQPTTFLSSSTGASGLQCSPVAKTAIRLENRNSMCVHNIGDMISDKIRTEGYWDEPLCLQVQGIGAKTPRKKDEKQAAPKLPWFIDAGANIGFISICGFSQMPVLSIEAAPWNFKKLQETSRHWRSGMLGRPWEVANVALNREGGGTMQMLGSWTNYGGSTLVRPGNHPDHWRGWGEGPDITRVPVNTSTLDNVVRARIPAGECIAAMKIDIEGFELFALQGATHMFKERPPCHIFMEFYTTLLRAASSSSPSDTSPQQLIQLLEDSGYTTDAKLPKGGENGLVENVHWRLMSPPPETTCVCEDLKNEQQQFRAQKLRKGDQDQDPSQVMPSSPEPRSQEGHEQESIHPLACSSQASTNIAVQHTRSMCVHDGGDLISDTIRNTGVWDNTLCQEVMSIGERYHGRRWFIDAGANIGFISVCGFSKMPVLSIEAAPWNFNKLQETSRHWHSGVPSRSWQVANVALNKEGGGTMQMLGSWTNYGGSTLVNPNNHPDHRIGWGEGPDITRVQVSTATLDNVVHARIPAGDCIAVMKIDIEGFELFALQGATRMFQERPPCHIFMEFFSVLLKAASSSNSTDKSPQILIHLMKQAGYVTDSAAVLPKGDENVIIESVHWRLMSPPSGSRCICEDVRGS